MKKYCFLICIISFSQNLYAQQDIEYSLILFDYPGKPYTIRQSDENSQSIYRFAAREVDKALSPIYSYLVQFATLSLFLVNETHNTAQQSILSSEGISSISVPHMFNKDFTPSVSGIRDAELQQLRDTKLPTYIRLHISPFESDYALALRTNSLLSWNKESSRVMSIEYLVHKYDPIFSLFVFGLFGNDKATTTKEESNELERIIADNEIYGAIRHLHRPDMEFHRYTAYGELTDEEKKFSKRVGWRSLINLADPTMWFQNGFRVKSGNKINFMCGYNMAPFGDYIDQHFWLMTRKLNAHFYLREYENRNTWFPAMGAEFANIQPFKWMMFDVALHGWQQPQDLDFNTNKGRYGGAIDVTLKFFDKDFIKKDNVWLSLNVGITAKTQGYLLEEMAMGNHVGGRVGVSVWVK